MSKLITIFLFAFNLLVIFFFWWSHSSQQLLHGGGETFIALGRIVGLLASFSVLLQFFLIGRPIWLEKAVGLDHLAKIHHYNGFISIVLILLHPILLILGYAPVTRSSLLQQYFIFIQQYEDVLQASIASWLFLGIVFFSIYIIRKKLRYEYWYGIHLLSYLALLFAWGHQLKNGEDFLVSRIFTSYWYGLFILGGIHFILLRFIRPYYLFYKHQFRVEKVVQETPSAVSVHISGKNLNNFPVTAGQFMIFRFLTPSLFWEAHPFSLSQAPDGKQIRITVKNVGDFTKRMIQLPKNTRVIIDGPYGIFQAKQAKRNHILLIAGGIGITPLFSLMQEMLKDGKNIILLYTNRTKDDVVFNAQLDALQKKYSCTIHYLFTRDKEATKKVDRLSIGLIHSLVPDITKRAVYICGPQRMIDDVKNMLLTIGVDKSSIFYEKFSL